MKTWVLIAYLIGDYGQGTPMTHDFVGEKACRTAQAELTKHAAKLGGVELIFTFCTPKGPL